MLGQGPPRYCYISGDGAENPTLRVHPGDELIIHFQNDLAPIGKTPGNSPMQMAKPATGQDAGDCNGGPVNASGTNLHFHGLDLPPTCHQDDVLRTVIQPGQSFDYRVHIPQHEPPGLYWYHPHLHGFTERQVQGGASGALIVEGIENTEASLRGLRQRVLVLRDESPTTTGLGGTFAPAWDISINQVPVIYPQYEAAIIQTRPDEKELWRVLNAGADTIFDLQIIVNHVPQALQVVAMDGVPIAGSDRPSLQQTSILLPPGARAEFIVTTPKVGDQAQLVTRRWDTGPEGDVDPERPIANILNEDTDTAHGDTRREKSGMVKLPYRKQLDDGAQVVQRRLYFSQVSPNGAAGELGDADVSVFYYLTVAGQKPSRY
jgi:FtsP/CotA-like multicopper oxidase with cupredoxin domain